VYDFTGKELGRGRFGETHIIIHRETREAFACKSIHKEHLVYKADVAALKREIDMLKLFKRYDCIASFHDVFEDEVFVHIVMELCTGGELFSKIVQKKRFSEYEAATMMRNILSTVVLCHDHYIVHSDLKPENFIFSHTGPGSKLKAIDFGISQFCQVGQQLHDLVGTVSYMAPDVLMKNYSFEADVWSCGVILYLLICGEPPFYGKSREEVAKSILFWDVDFSFEPWPSVSPSLKRCIMSMLEREPTKRATARDVLFCDWMVEQHAAPRHPIPNAIFSKLQQFSKYNLLKRLALRLIAASLPECDTVALKTLYQQLKRDGRSSLSASELESAMLNKGQDIKELDIQELVRDISVDGRESISFLDFMAANMRLGQLASQENIEYAFRKIDLDGNDFIDLEDLTAFLSEKCSPYKPTDEDIELIMEEADINRDNRIDFAEFRALMKGSY